MMIEYVVRDVTVIDPDQLQVVVLIQTVRVVNGYGGGVITITVPRTNTRAAIETAVLKKFTREVSPQQHDLTLNGDCSKVEQVQEELELFEAQRRERMRDAVQGTQESGTPEGQQEPTQSVEVSDREDPRDEAVQEATPAVDEAGQADVPSVVEESPKE